MKKVLTSIEEWQKTYIKGYDMYVLRERNTNIAVNVSYSIDGLVWTSDQYGNYIYFKNPRIFRYVDVDTNKQHVSLKGDSINNRYYVEKFIPKDHISDNGRFAVKNQLAEYYVTAKALRLLTPMNSIDSSMEEIKSLSYK